MRVRGRVVNLDDPLFHTQEADGSRVQRGPGERVLEAAAKGMSARQAAERFGVGVSTATVWVRRSRLNSERSARRQG